MLRVSTCLLKKLDDDDDDEHTIAAYVLNYKHEIHALSYLNLSVDRFKCSL